MMWDIGVPLPTNFVNIQWESNLFSFWLVFERRSWFCFVQGGLHDWKSKRQMIWPDHLNELVKKTHTRDLQAQKELKSGQGVNRREIN